MAAKTLGSTEYQQEILDRIDTLSHEDQARWGKMSVHQMLCHLRDSYCIALGDKSASAATGPVQRTVVKWMALWAPMPWPKGFQTRPEVEQGKGGSAPGEFEADREALRLVLSRFCQVRECRYPHPVFGPMNAIEWCRWGYLHADHHLRQFGR